jgi:two-component sensor histidine kinase
MMAGPDHRFRLANAAYRRLIGGRSLIGKPAREALPEIEGQGFFEMLDEVFQTGRGIKGHGSKVVLERTPGAPPEERILDFIYQPVANAAGEITGVFVEGQDVTERTQAEEHLRLMVNELNHRVKNTLAMIQAIAAQTFRNADDVRQAQESFNGRILALARANDLLTGERWVGASLKDVIQTTMEAYCADGTDRCRVEGPPVRLSAKTALSLSMALHELATNALKYGAWSSTEGKVEIAWSVIPAASGERLVLEWRESGGPPVPRPARRGFGSRLIERGLAAEMGGEARLEFRPEGLACVIDAPLPRDEDDSRDG